MGKRKYGWIRDSHDIRDRLYLGEEDVTSFPPGIDLRPKFPPCYDQGQTGSCTGNATAGAIHYDRIIEGLDVWTPSRLFIYYNTRVIEGTTSEDAGGTLRNSVKSVVKYGTCTETLWPYIEEKFADKPSDDAYGEAKKHVAIQYLRINDGSLTRMKSCLEAGFPFVFGMSVYASFESPDVAKTGKVPLPSDGEECLGGHALCCVGYIDADECFIIRNSWGQWGDNGYCYVPYAYLTDTNLANDFWTIRKVG
jgi:C1A family cysteine protease